MKAISLWAPWSNLLVLGAKTIETRGWPTTYRGPLVIHAAKKWDSEIAELARLPEFRTALEPAYGADYLKNLSRGCLLGVVEVVGCKPIRRVGDQVQVGSLLVNRTEQAFGDYRDGRFGWLCVNPRPFAHPVPYRGSQGLFDVPDDLVQELLAGRNLCREDESKSAAPPMLF